MNNKEMLKKVLIVIGLVVIAIVLYVAMPKKTTTEEMVVPTEGTETVGSTLPGSDTTPGIVTPTKPVVKPSSTGGISPTPVPVAGGKTLRNEQYGVTLSYPTGFVAATEAQNKDLPWRYNSAFPGTRIFTLTLPKSFQPNTNFSEAMVTVGVSMDPTGVNGCMQAENGEIARSSGTAFSRFTLSDAGAGNYYETTSYRTLKNGACLSIETVIHSTSIDAYPTSSGIKAFNKSAVQQKLNQIINSVELL